MRKLAKREFLFLPLHLTHAYWERDFHTQSQIITLLILIANMRMQNLAAGIKGDYQMGKQFLRQQTVRHDLCVCAPRAATEKFVVGCANATATPHYPLVHIPRDALLIAMSIHTSAPKNRFLGAVWFAGAERKSRLTVIAKSGFFVSHHITYGK